MSQTGSGGTGDEGRPRESATTRTAAKTSHSRPQAAYGARSRLSPFIALQTSRADASNSKSDDRLDKKRSATQQNAVEEITKFLTGICTCRLNPHASCD